MMHPYPFLGGYGFRRPHPYYSYPKPSNNINKNFNLSERKPCFPSAIPKQEHKQEHKQEQGNFGCSYNSSENKNCKANNVEDIENDSEECFEIFGLKLHSDDLLIIALLFFLYQEEVKDTYLYIALILLLLS